MSSATNDQSYGQTAVSLGCVAEAQVQECLQIQAALRKMGLDEPLGELLAKKGYLTPQQHSSILKKLGIQTSPIPGYTLLGKIGQGGMGTVYKALQTSVNRTVAIKILAPSATKDKTFVARFLQEAQSAAALNHKNLISAIDVGISNGINYFIMEFVTGKSCREVLNAKGPFTEKDALSIGLQMAEVLEHIHQHRMVHRDIKPENIMLTAEGQVKLCDLGLAKSTGALEQSLTQEGLTVGTPYFMSPEQIRGDKDVDIRADLYSLGATLYFLVTGKHPYEGKSAAETMSLHLNQPVPDPRRAVPNLNEDLALVIQKLMAKDRAQRYQTPAELLEDLKRLQAGSTPPLARQHAARAHVMRTQRRVVKKETPKWPVAAAVGLVVLGGASAFLFRTSTPVETTKTVVVHVPAPAAPAAGPQRPVDDPKKVAEAAGLFSTADQLIRGDKWREALLELQKLRTQYGGLEYTRGRMAAIGEMTGLCEGKLKAAESTQTRQVADAQAAFKEGHWQDALGRFQALVKAGHAGYQREADVCRRELGAEALVKEVRAALAASSWQEVLAKTLTLFQQHQTQKLQSVEKHQGELTTMLLKARAEQEAVKGLTDIHAASVASNWKEMARLLPDFEKHRETETYRSKSGELKDLRSRLMQANEAAAEDAAQQAWLRTLEAYGDFIVDRRYDEAEDALKAFQQAYLQTKTARQKEVELQAKLVDAGKKRTKDRDDESKKLWAQIQKEFKGQQFESAAENLARLTTEFSDTSVIKSAASTIKTYKSYLDSVVRPPEYLVAELDFDDFPGLWSARGGAQAANSNDDPYHGRRSARLSLPADSTVLHPLTGVTARAEFLSFYARLRAPARSAKIRILLYDTLPMGGMTASFIHELTLTPEWQKHGIRLSEFKPYGPAALARRGLEPRQITAILFGAPEDAAAGVEIQVDVLRIEAGKSGGK